MSWISRHSRELSGELDSSSARAGERNWWFLGPGGVAKLYSWHVGDDGAPTAEADQWLHDQGMYRLPRRSSYTLTVLTTTHCNLGCSYCFQNLAQDGSGGTAPPRISYARLNSATITKVLEFTRRRMAASGFSRLHITLFGGEPLLNPRACEELLERAAPFGLRSAGMISNGTMLSGAAIKRLRELGLRSIQITFDGDQLDHDASRVKRTGGGTFDTIVSKIREVQDATDVPFAFRVNVTAQNLPRIEQLVDRLADRLVPDRCVIYFKVVGEVGNGFRNDVAVSDPLMHKFINWYRQALDRGFRVSRPQELMPCSACSFPNGKYGAVVNADGTLSSCWESAGKPEWQVGTVVDGYLPEQVTSSRWTTCEEDYQNFADRGAWDRFYDTVDAALMDNLAALGRL